MAGLPMESLSTGLLERSLGTEGLIKSGWIGILGQSGEIRVLMNSAWIISGEWIEAGIKSLWVGVLEPSLSTGLFTGSLGASIFMNALWAAAPLRLRRARTVRSDDRRCSEERQNGDEKEEDGVVGRGMSHFVLSFIIRIHDDERYAGPRRPIMRLRRHIAVAMTRAPFY